MGKVYICTGSCHGVASREEYEKGATTCGAKSCENYGEPLQARKQCASCKKAGPQHACVACLSV